MNRLHSVSEQSLWTIFYLKIITPYCKICLCRYNTNVKNIIHFMLPSLSPHGNNLNIQVLFLKPCHRYQAHKKQQEWCCRLSTSVFVKHSCCHQTEKKSCLIQCHRRWWTEQAPVQIHSFELSLSDPCQIETVRPWRHDTQVRPGKPLHSRIYHEQITLSSMLHM